MNDDLISRQKALEKLMRRKPNFGFEDDLKARFKYMEWMACMQAIREVPTEHPKIGEWIPCTVLNECFIPELKYIGYKAVLFTYKTRTGKNLVKTNWIERGRIIGKQMNGVPIAYMILPEPYKEATE